MSPNLLLGVVSAFAAFLLKTTLAFGVCAALAWLVDSPNRKFVIWISFLTGAAGYWLWTILAFLPAMPSSTHALPAVTATQTAAAAVATLHAWQIPNAWSFPLGIAVRGLAGIYLLVVAYLLASHVRKQRHLKWVLSFTSEPPAEITELFRPLAKELHADRSRLLILSGVSSPATFGWLRPTILLPAACLEQSPQELEDILRHELHHIRRWDFAWNALALVCRSVLFFHPAAWYAVSRMQYHRELACDLAVVAAFPERRAGYAECLIHFARLNLVNDQKNWGIDFAASNEQLKARVHSVLADSKKTSWAILGLRGVCSVALFAGFLSVAPSLAVLLSFAPGRVTQPATPSSTPELTATPPGATRQAKRNRVGSPALTSTVTVPVTDAQPPEAKAGNALRETASVPQLPAGPGPKLMHRPAPGLAPQAGAAPQQTITFDDGGNPVGKKGDANRADAVQQTATAAAALYKALGSLKPEK
jgi:beta-lactamase regulating signal transducer with metallopeptidase domain